MKKVVCIVLLLSCLVMVSCTSPKQKTRDIVGEAGASSVAELHIYAYAGDGGGLPLVPNMGHGFISVKNLTDSAFDIGGHEVEAGEEITIGLWGQKVIWSVWFNLEIHYFEKDMYKNAVSVKRGIKSLDEIEILSNYVKNAGKWTFSYNCSAFAHKAWNTVAGEDAITMKGRSTPKKLYKQIKRFKTYETERKITNGRKPSYVKGGEFIYVTPK